MKNRKKNISQKYQELWERYSSNSNLDLLVSMVRKRFSIDTTRPDDFIRRTLTWKKGRSWEDAVYEVLFTTMPQYMEPEGDFLFTALETYIIYGKDGVGEYFKLGMGYTFGVSVFKGSSLKNHLVKFGDRYEDGAFVYVPPYISKLSFMEAVDKKWEEIQGHLKGSTEKNNYSKLKRLRSHNWKKNRLVFSLYSQSRRVLGLKKGELKEIKVSSILREKHGVYLEPENVKVIAHRMRNFSKEKKVTFS